MESVGIAGILDVETTGLDSKADEIVELSLILFTFNRKTGEILEIVDEYCGLREPSVPIRKETSRIHGIYKRTVRGKTLDHSKIESMIARAEFFVAHNARFDWGFVVRMFPSAAEKPWLCSMNGINWKEKGFLSKGLQNLLKDHGIEPETKHRAGHDTRATLTLLSMCNSNGKTYFWELLQSPSYQREVARKEVAASTGPREEPREEASLQKASKAGGCLLPILMGALLVLALSWVK
ncbi:exonuclease domain-containing protein [Desulfofundulus salinus]|uniref:DNA polymerase III subunit epsilon n=1 Tax=Desulfofundulus salinus TaxID=2419843 RepID=A0A494WYY4_9FIRM|nr:exonuclease domain-containing protein [Desulfofundulus salinum]RKO65754.1 DNA polymerase III subunit epsilon [Desulfofundulus salinum]